MNARNDSSALTGVDRVPIVVQIDAIHVDNFDHIGDGQINFRGLGVAVVVDPEARIGHAVRDHQFDNGIFGNRQACVGDLTTPTQSAHARRCFAVTGAAQCGNGDVSATCRRVRQCRRDTRLGPRRKPRLRADMRQNIDHTAGCQVDACAHWNGLGKASGGGGGGGRSDADVVKINVVAAPRGTRGEPDEARTHRQRRCGEDDITILCSADE